MTWLKIEPTPKERVEHFLAECKFDEEKVEHVPNGFWMLKQQDEYMEQFGVRKWPKNNDALTELKNKILQGDFWELLELYIVGMQRNSRQGFYGDFWYEMQQDGGPGKDSLAYVKLFAMIAAEKLKEFNPMDDRYGILWIPYGPFEAFAP